MMKSKNKGRRRSKKSSGSSFSDSPSPDKGKGDRLVPEETFLDKLVKKADHLRDTFEFDLSIKFYKRVLECDAEHMAAMENLAHVYFYLGKRKSAEKYILQALQLNPDKGYAKYFYMGQMKKGHEAIDYFKRGISVLESHADMSCQAAFQSAAEDRPRDLSMAYCCMVEVYMTDLCDEEDAESQCKGFIDSAIAADESNPEAHLCLASYHLVKEEQEDARKAVEKSLSVWFPDYQQTRGQENKECPVSFDSRVNTSKILIEVSMFDEASEILEGLLEEDDEEVQVWYLLGLLNYLRGDDYYGNARFYLNKGLKVCKKLDLEDEEQVPHMQQMLSEMGPGSDDENEDEDKENKEQNDKDDEEEYETVSEEEMES